MDLRPLGTQVCLIAQLDAAPADGIVPCMSGGEFGRS